VKLAAAIALGVALALLPFLQFAVGHGHSHSVEAHADHTSKHAGRVAMVGDHHMEVVESDEKLRVFVSDALRRPLRPQRGDVRFDDGERLAMEWRTSHFSIRRESPRFATDLSIELDDGMVLEARVAPR
jgi:hypothetical protein